MIILLMRVHGVFGTAALQLNPWEGPMWLKLDQVLKELKIPAAGAHEQRQVSRRGSKFAF